MKITPIILIAAFTSCILKEDAPVVPTRVIVETPVAINPPCSYSNYMILEAAFGDYESEIRNINEYYSSDYLIAADIGRPSDDEGFSIQFDLGRPKKNIIYDYDGIANWEMPIDWDIEINNRIYKPEKGLLYVEVLPNNKIKFTWCNMAFWCDWTNREDHMGSGSFILD